MDLLLNQTELEDIYTELHPDQKNFTLFSEEKFWSMSPQEYMPIFTSPLPEANYGTLIASTAGHWTTTVLRGFRDESKASSGYGIEKVLDLFSVAMKKWADEVQAALDKDRLMGTKKDRRVVVRSYLPGHENCRNQMSPITTNWGWPPKLHSYNWPWIKDYNTIFQVRVRLIKSCIIFTCAFRNFCQKTRTQIYTICK